MESALNPCLTTESARPNGHELVDRMPGAPADEASEPMSPMKEDPPPLCSVHTSNSSAILQKLGICVVVTTYQAGKLVMLRPDVSNDPPRVIADSLVMPDEALDLAPGTLHDAGRETEETFMPKEIRR